MTLYYANRDRLNYLELQVNEAHSLLSVAGGLGFLYFINEHTRHLCIVDNNPEQIEYVELMIELIKNSENLLHFVRLISGSDPDFEAFPGLKDGARAASDIPLSPKYRELYIKHLESNFSNPAIDYYGPSNLEPGRFYWRFGASHTLSPFKSQESFSGLAAMLRNLQTETVIGDLCDLDYGRLLKPDLLNVICVTNADFNFYTPGDRILRRIVDTGKISCRVLYHSWDRTIRFSPGLHHEDTLLRLRPLTQGRELVEIQTYVGAKFSQPSLEAMALQQISLSDIGMFSSFKSPADCLLYHISVEPGNPDKERIAREVLSAAYRNFRRIIILDHLFASSIGDWMQWCMDLRFNITYFVSQIEFAGGDEAFSRNFILCWDQRGE